MKCIEDEIPFDVPEGWEWCRLLNVCNVFNGYAFKSSEFSDEGVTVVRISDINNNSVLIKNCVHWIGKIEDKFLIKKGDLLIAMSGATTGKLGKYHYDEPAYLNQRVGNIRIKNNSILCENYRDLFLQSMQSTILENAYGGAQPNISSKEIEKLIIPLPPLAEQKRIAKKYNKYVTKINVFEKEQQDITLLMKRIKFKVLDLAVRGKLVPQDPNDEPASVLLERIRTEKEELIKQGKIKRDKKESIIFRGDDNSYYQSEKAEPLEMPFDIPDSWTWSNLQELCNYGNCINVSFENIPNDAWILDLEDIEKDSGKVLQHMTNAQRQSSSIKHKFHKHMVLYSKLRPYLNKVVLADGDGYCTSEILPLDFVEEIYPRYAQFFLMSPFFVKYASHRSYGMKMPRLGAKDGQRAYFAIPPYKEQLRIVHTVDTIFDKIQSIENEIL